MNDGGVSGCGAPADFGARLDAARAEARGAAHSELEARNFRLRANGEWHGMLEANGAQIPAIVRIPSSFPDKLPDILVDRARLGRRIAHIEESNKVCIVPSSGVLLDATRPRKLIVDALHLAACAVTSGLDGATDVDFEAEFLAYWSHDSKRQVHSIANPNGFSRPLARVKVDHADWGPEKNVLLADSFEEAEAWVRRIGGNAVVEGDAYFITLASSFTPPDFGERVTVRKILELVVERTEQSDFRQFRTWLAATTLPATIIIALPESIPDGGRTLIGLRVESLGNDLRKRAHRGFRPGSVPAGRELAFALNSATTRTRIERLDAPYLVARGGGSRRLLASTVTLIGVGAVGSHIATHLASLGVGGIRLIDSELLTADNVHRHSLGVQDIGKSKASAHASELAARFPHLAFVSRHADVELVLRDEPDLFLGSDLVVIALGDDTLELRLNDLLYRGPPRIHAWVEPLGLAGHALLCGVKPTELGCFRCLIRPDKVFGLVNLAALTAPGQEIRRSLAGCAGTFSPFSALDADRTALEAAELAGRLLVGEQADGELVTWRGDSDQFVQSGYKLSERARVVTRGQRVRLTAGEFRRVACATCSKSLKDSAIV